MIFCCGKNGVCVGFSPSFTSIQLFFFYLSAFSCGRKVLFLLCFNYYFSHLLFFSLLVRLQFATFFCCQSFPFCIVVRAIFALHRIQIASRQHEYVFVGIGNVEQQQKWRKKRKRWHSAFKVHSRV